MPEPEVSTPVRSLKRPRKSASPEGVKRQTVAFAAKQGFRGYILMPVMSHNMMKAYVVKIKGDEFRESLPKILWWPSMLDFDGAKGMVSAVIENNLGMLSELKLRYPEHRFGFEDLLTGHDRNKDMVECMTVASFNLQRGHRLDFDLIKTINGSTLLNACIRREHKTIMTETVFDSEFDDNGTDEATVEGSISL